ncbi:MAG: lytic transglycosylase domain-containing protein [Bdellovibrionales bacterium]
MNARLFTRGLGLLIFLSVSDVVHSAPDTPIATPAPTATPAQPLSPESDWQTLKLKILNDFGDRIAREFKVPKGLAERTSFWFDVYGRYGEAHHIIHHVRYPWVVFKVVDTTQMLEHGKGPLWLRRERAQKLARLETAAVRKALARLSRRSSFKNLPPLEKRLFEVLARLPGSRRAVFRFAAQNVRSQLGQKTFFERGLVSSSKYLPYMEDEFRQAGLPVELTRMPFVESSFNVEARSKVGASGIWQIMPRTGKSYMIVNDNIDERNSPLKATRAAARLLRGYYRSLDSWPLTITSYNHGIGNIQKAIKAARSRDLATIISRYHRGDFKFASSNFFTCFLAALHAEKYHELVFKDLPREPLQEYEIYRLAGRTRASYLAKLTGLPKDELLDYNLDLRNALRRNSLVPKGYNLHLPPAAKDRLMRRIGTQEKPGRPSTQGLRERFKKRPRGRSV